MELERGGKEIPEFGEGVEVNVGEKMGSIVKRMWVFALLLVVLSLPWDAYMLHSGHVTLGAVTGFNGCREWRHCCFALFCASR